MSKWFRLGCDFTYIDKEVAPSVLFAPTQKWLVKVSVISLIFNVCCLVTAVSDSSIWTSCVSFSLFKAFKWSMSPRSWKRSFWSTNSVTYGAAVLRRALARTATWRLVITKMHFLYSRNPWRWTGRSWGNLTPRMLKSTWSSLKCTRWSRMHLHSILRRQGNHHWFRSLPVALKSNQLSHVLTVIILVNRRLFDQDLLFELRFTLVLISV